MATKHASGTRSEVVRCPHCGEDYSITYKRCPFCDERAQGPAEEYALSEEELEGDAPPPKRPGKRMSGGRRGGGYGREPLSPLRIGVTIASLATIVAAVWIVFSWVAPMIDRGNLAATPPPSATPPATASPVPTPPGDPNLVAPPDVTGGDAVVPSAAPSPAVGTTAPESKPGSLAFTLNRQDFTLVKAGETFTMKATGASGAVTWGVENPGVVTIDQNGKVTAVGKGDTNVFAVAADGAVAKCIVRSKSGPAAPPAAVTTPAPTPATPAATPSKPPVASLTPSQTPVATQAPAAAAVTLNRQDFTLLKAGETFTMKVTGATGTPVWSIDKTTVATIDQSGKVTAVAKGTATITCKVDGQTLTCIVRCQF